MEMYIHKEIKIGILAITTSIILYFGFLFLKGKNLFTIDNIYYTKYERNKGIRVATPIVINDYVVGSVKDIKILPKENFSTLVTFEIQKDIQITDKSEIRITNAGLIEGKVLELSIHPGTPLASHSMISGSIDPSIDTIDLFADKMQSIVSHAEKTIKEFDILISKLVSTTEILNCTIDINKKNIFTISKNIAEISHVLSNHKRGISPILSTVNNILKELESIQFSKIAYKADSIVDKMHSIVSDVQDKKGTLGLLLYDNTLYDSVNNSIRHLDNLLLDIKKYPRAYLNFSIFNSAPQKR